MPYVMDTTLVKICVKCEVEIYVHDLETFISILLI